jgi:hypothetical protein
VSLSSRELLRRLEAGEGMPEIGKMSRRGLLGGAGAAVLTAGGLALPAEARGPRPLGEGVWDVRPLVPDSDDDGCCIECDYRHINLTQFLIEGIIFEELFGTEMDPFLPTLYPRLQLAADAGLLFQLATVQTLIVALHLAEPTRTLADFFVLQRTAFAAETLTTLFALRRLGILFPLPALTMAQSKQRNKALNNFINRAGALTFLSLFTTPVAGTNLKTLAAIRALFALNMFTCLLNDRACRPAGSLDLVVPNLGTWCNLTAIGGNHCSVASDVLR